MYFCLSVSHTHNVHYTSRLIVISSPDDLNSFSMSDTLKSFIVDRNEFPSRLKDNNYNIQS